MAEDKEKSGSKFTDYQIKMIFAFTLVILGWGMVAVCYLTHQPRETVRNLTGAVTTLSGLVGWYFFF